VSQSFKPLALSQPKFKQDQVEGLAAETVQARSEPSRVLQDDEISVMAAKHVLDRMQIIGIVPNMEDPDLIFYQDLTLRQANTLRLMKDVQAKYQHPWAATI
jgi:hypothetical protein